MNNLFAKNYQCLQSNKTTVMIAIKQFPPNCPKINYNNQCSSAFSAWLPAITVCRQALFV